MRVLFVTPFYAESYVMGGMAIAPAQWAETLVAYGLEVDVFTTTANGSDDLDVPLGVPIEHGGVSITYFPRLRQSGNLFVSLPLLHKCQQTMATYDIVHSIGLWTFPSIISSIIARRSKIPYALSLHGMLMPWAYNRHGMRKKLLLKLLEKKRISRAHSVFCTTDLEMRYFQQLGFGAAEIVPNIVSPPDMDVDEARSRFRQRFRLENKTVLLFAGRLVRNKGVHLTISAFKKIAAKHPETKLIIVGPFEDEAGQLAQQQVMDLKLDERVLFLGLQTGLDYWDSIAGADLFVLNSYSENFGMAPAEALSVGIPVLLSDQVGIANLVRHYNAGEITSLDVDDIAETLNMMVADKDNLAAMGKNGIQLVQDHFSSIAVGQRLADLLTVYQK